MKTLIRILFPTAYEAIRAEGYDAAVTDILKIAEKIYTGPLTIGGDGPVLVQNNTFLSPHAPSFKIAKRSEL